RIDTLATLTQLGIGEALVGTLEDRGTPAMVQRVAIAPPQSRIGPLTDAERTALVRGSPLLGRYERALDRESAYELLQARAARSQPAPTQPPKKPAAKQESGVGEFLGGLA